MGNPRAGTAAKGQAMLDGVVDEVTAFLTEFAEWPEAEIIGPK